MKDSKKTLPFFFCDQHSDRIALYSLTLLPEIGNVIKLQTTRINMPVIQLQAELSMDQLVNAVNQLSEAERDKLLSRFMSHQPLYKEHRLTREESDLLMKINRGVPDAIQQKYNNLISKRKEQTLTDEEYRELLYVTEKVERLDAQRLDWLTKLAQIRKKPLGLLMEELSIKAPPVL